MKDQLRQLSRRELLRLGLLGGAGLAILGCKPESPKPVNSEPEVIKTARRLQQEAVARGEFRFPLPKVVTDMDNIRLDNYTPFVPSKSEAKEILIEIPPSKKNLWFPSLVEGKVIKIINEPEGLKSITIQMEDQIWYFDGGPADILQKQGDIVSLGEPILNLNLQVPNPERPATFLRNVIFIGAYNVNKTPNLSNLTLDNILKGPDGQAVLIPNHG